MNELNRIINEAGLSKVRVARYLGVSRQMLYNYLALNSYDELPKDKYNKLLKLFGIEDFEELKKIKVTNDFISSVETRINEEVMENFGKDNIADLRGLNKKEQDLLADVFNILKEKLVDKEEGNEEAYHTLKYLYNYLQIMESVEELKYIIVYICKFNGMTPPLEFIYDEDKQYTFEGILYSAMMLYTNGGASKNRVVESHKKFEMEIEHKKEEKLSRTQELNTFKAQALNELGYTEINGENAKEVFEKIAQIMSRKF